MIEGFYTSFIQWLCHKPFFRDIYLQGGKDSFKHAREDVMEMYADRTEERAQELVKERMDALLGVVDTRKVITFNEREKAVYIGGERVNDPAMLQNLKAEAEALMNFDVWQILHETPKRLAQKALFEDDGKSEILHAKGRSILYMLDTQKKILATLRSYK